jgi:hypothetical protein
MKRTFAVAMVFWPKIMAPSTICIGMKETVSLVFDLSIRMPCRTFISLSLKPYEVINLRQSVKLLLSNRWSVRHMLVEVLAVGLFIYLQFSDKYLSLWAMAAAILSLAGMEGSNLTTHTVAHVKAFLNRTSDRNLS